MSAPFAHGKAAQKDRKAHFLAAPKRHGSRCPDLIVGEEELAGPVEGGKALRGGIDRGDEAALGLPQGRRALENLDLQVEVLTLGLLARQPLLRDVTHEGDPELALGHVDRKAVDLEAALLTILGNGLVLKDRACSFCCLCQRSNDIIFSENRIQILHPLSHGLLGADVQQVLHAWVPEQASELGVEHDDALIADVADDKIRKLLLLLEQLLGLAGLLHPFEETYQQECRAYNDAGDESQAFEQNPQIIGTLHSGLIATEHEDPVGSIPKRVGEIPHLSAKRHGGLGVDFTLKERFGERHMKIGLLQIT